MFARPSLSLIAIAGALLGATVAAGAQSSPYPLPSAPAAAAGTTQSRPAGGHRRNRMMAMLQQLNLSADQHAKIVAMFKDFRASRSTGAPMTRRQLRSNIEAVLTSDQVTKLHTMMRQGRQRGSAPAGAST